MSKKTIESINSRRHSTSPANATQLPPSFPMKGFSYLSDTVNEQVSPTYRNDGISGLKHDNITSGLHTNFAIPTPINQIPRAAP
jgi:hypothetical protein